MADDSPQDFGTFLRQAREKTGISLGEIATTTKISVPALEALERNDASRLPGGIFSRAFVRAYAREVGLDPEDAVRRFVARFPDQALEEEPTTYDANPARISVEEEPAASWLKRAVMWSVPIALVVAYFGFGGRLPWWRDQPRPVDRPAELASEPAPPSPSAPVMSEPSAPKPTTESSQDAGTAGALPGAALPATVPPPASVANASPSGTGQATPATPASTAAVSQTPAAEAAGGSFRLALAPKGDCWVDVRSNGVPVFSGLMHSGDRQLLVVRGDVSLSVGNAGAMALSINDQAARPLGGPGQVVTLRLTADTLKQFLQIP
jgi:cytoskeleton protein RodZ